MGRSRGSAIESAMLSPCYHGMCFSTPARTSSAAASAIATAHTSREILKRLQVAESFFSLPSLTNGSPFSSRDMLFVLYCGGSELLPKVGGNRFRVGARNPAHDEQGRRRD